VPNWCNNVVVFTSSPADVAAFRELLGADRGAFDLNAVVAMPAELDDCNLSDVAAYRLKFGDWESEPWASSFEDRDDVLAFARHPDNAERWYTADGAPRTFDEAADLAHANVVCHGAVYWHPWRELHWGTKWNVPPGEAAWTGTADRAVVEFDTAWTPPLPVLEELGRRFPAAALSAKYDERDGGFRGAVRLAGGVVVMDEREEYTQWS
jgi:hypothetical protein